MAVKFGPNVKSFERILFADFAEFMFQYFGNHFDLTIRRKKIAGDTHGLVDLWHLMQGKNDLVLSTKLGTSFALNMIAHEMTHMDQYVRGDIAFNRETNMVAWKNVDIVHISKLKNLRGDEYHQLPWEIEAHQNQNTLATEYRNSGRIEALKGNDDILDMIINMGGL